MRLFRRIAMAAVARSGTAALGLAVAVGGGCAPPGLSDTSGAPSAAGSAAVASSSPGAPSPAGLPGLLFAGPTGLVTSSPGRPLERTRVGLPAGTWQSTAAVGPSGAVLLVAVDDAVPASAVVGHLSGARIEPRWVVALPVSAGPAVLPGCVAGDGTAVVIADRLVYLAAGRVAGTRDTPATAGRCQMLEDGAVAYLAEADHAVVVWQPGRDSVVVTGTDCDDLAVGGGLVACLRDDGGVAVGPLVPPMAGKPAFDEHVAERAVDPVAGPAHQVLLDSAGDWLAVVTGDGSAVQLSRVAGGRIVPAGAFSLRSGEALLGFVGP